MELLAHNKYIKNKNYIATSFVPKNSKELALKNSELAIVVDEKIITGAELNFDSKTLETDAMPWGKLNELFEGQWGETGADFVAVSLKQQKAQGGKAKGFLKNLNPDLVALKIADFEDKSLLIVDDDDPFRGRLARAMEKKGFQVTEAKSVEEGLRIANKTPTNFAVIDLRLEDGSGLEVVKALHKSKKESRIVMLTGYGNLPTAVAAVKAGAIDYIAKPVDADDVEAALLASPESKAKPPENPMSADRVRWEHIQRVYELCDRNVSETARRLNMHRRTLQRILAKRSPR